jgi:hypothetical protein
VNTLISGREFHKNSEVVSYFYGCLAVRIQNRDDKMSHRKKIKHWKHLYSSSQNIGLVVGVTVLC